MRRSRLIFPLAFVGVVAVAAIAMAADEGSRGGNSSGASADTPTAFAANGGNRRGERRFHGGVGDADVRAVLEDIREAVAKQAPEIAGPVIDKAEEEDKITAAQADRLRQAAEDLAGGKRPDIRALGRDADVHEVVRDAFAAAAKKAPEIGEPIIEKAVEDDKITEAQADRIREMLKRAPRGGPGFGKRSGPGHGGPPRIADADVRAVLDDVRDAVAKEAPDIAGPIIDKAEDDDKITAAQADRLREAAKSLGAGARPGLGPRGMRTRDADVQEVLHDVFAAVAAKAPGIAKPIIDKAVADDKITAAQADQVRSMLSHARRGKGRGPGHGPPGMGERGMGGPGHGPGGFGPGGPPPSGESNGAPDAPSVPGSPS